MPARTGKGVLLGGWGIQTSTYYSSFCVSMATRRTPKHSLFSTGAGGVGPSVFLFLPGSGVYTIRNGKKILRDPWYFMDILGFSFVVFVDGERGFLRCFVVFVILICYGLLVCVWMWMWGG
ncbi:hypothetical protein DL95DRAFT_176189 [Leptodontidium sp. 2 PMI_412]|nr:hypothetical protein DL95DRAFT_176189 [Leptodontidium sp. 2 PMI_412]